MILFMPTRLALQQRGVVLFSPSLCCVYCFRNDEDVQHFFFTTPSLNRFGELYRTGVDRIMSRLWMLGNIYGRTESSLEVERKGGCNCLFGVLWFGSFGSIIIASYLKGKYQIYLKCHIMLRGCHRGGLLIGWVVICHLTLSVGVKTH